MRNPPGKDFDVSDIELATLEQSGPKRAVVKFYSANANPWTVRPRMAAIFGAIGVLRWH